MNTLLNLTLFLLLVTLRAVRFSKTENCLVYDSDFKCVACKEGFVLVVGGSQELCLECPSNNKNCSYRNIILNKSHNNCSQKSTTKGYPHYF